METAQVSFASGELSPLLSARTDLARYFTGLATAKNVFIHPQGGVSNRQGTYFMASTKDSTKKSVLIPFKFSKSQSYVMEFGNLYIRFFTTEGQILDVANAILEIVSPYVEADLFKIKYAQSADVMYLACAGYKPYQLVRNSSSSWTLSVFPFVNGPFMTSNSDATKTITSSALTGSVTLTSNFSLFNTKHVGAYFQIAHYMQSQSVTGTFTGATASSSIHSNGSWRFLTQGTWSGTLKLQRSYDSGATWTDLRTWNATSYNEVTADSDDEVCLMRVYMSVYTSGSCVYTLTTDPYTNYGICKITAVASATSATATVQSGIGATTATTNWAEGSWSDYRGWPTNVTFYQDRTVFSCTTTEPQTMFLSQLSDYVDFGRSSPLESTDGITTILQSRQVGNIQNIVDLGNLIILTDDLNWQFGPGSSSSSVTPESYKQGVLEHFGSSSCSPVVIGSRVIYVQSSGNIIMDSGYSLENDSIVSNNISVASEHLFDGHSIVQMDYQKEPYSIIWMVRDDGALLSLTHNREQQIVAWTRCETNGKVESLCCIPGDSYTEVFMIVKRKNGRFVEKLAGRMTTTNPEDQFFVDSGLSLDLPITITDIDLDTPIVITAEDHGLSNDDLVDFSDITWEDIEEDNGDFTQPDQLNRNRYVVKNVTTDTFEIVEENGDAVDTTDWYDYVESGYVRKCVKSVSGLDHLEGQKVTILANGFVEPKQTVTDGAISFDEAYSRIHVGLPYISDIETLSVDMATNTGSISAKRKRISKVTIKFLNSRGGFIGPDSSLLNELIQRSNEPLGRSGDLISGNQTISTSIGYDCRGKLLFRQVDPLPITISGIYPEVEIDD
jgi:hypothetical protein